MIAKLNAEQQQVLREHGEQPVELLDPETNRVYILIGRDQFERMRPIFENDSLTEKEKEHLLREGGRRAGWDDPEMDAYDQYDKFKSSS